MMKRYTDYPLKGHHTFGMDVRAAHFVEYDSVEELQALLLDRRMEWGDMPLLHIGRGSNLLFLSEVYRGVVLHSAIGGLEVVEEDDSGICLRVGSGIVWDEFVAHCVSHGWGGVENLSLIPGEVGASAVQNIGAYGAEAKDVIVKVETVEVATAKRRTFTNEECGYGYRQSVFKGTLRGQYIVTHVTFRLQKHPEYRLDYGNIRKVMEERSLPVTLETVREVVISIRKSKLPDPAEYGNAGSFFVNPVVEREKMEQLREEYPDMPFYETDDGRAKLPAGWLIERCGWKGRSLGRAAVHDKQALVLVNLGEATGREILALSDAVRQAVWEKFGVEIRPEVNFID